MSTTRLRAAEVRALVEAVDDPELPHVTIGDLGIVRDVDLRHDGHVAVELTPTYTGCPATEVIRDDVEETLRSAGLDPVVRFVLSPPWTTDWITPAGRDKLRRAGITPPHQVGRGPVAAPGSTTIGTPVDLPVDCPRCNSRRTRLVSAFGSTACKSAYVCDSCREPFELFKEL